MDFYRLFAYCHRRAFICVLRRGRKAKKKIEDKKKTKLVSKENAFALSGHASESVIANRELKKKVNRLCVAVCVCVNFRPETPRINQQQSRRYYDMDVHTIFKHLTTLTPKGGRMGKTPYPPMIPLNDSAERFVYCFLSLLTMHAIRWKHHRVRATEKDRITQ